jgi:hypothetical protein
MDPAQLAADLERFRGSDHFYEHWSKAFEYTDGVKYLADNAGAHWLLDMISSWLKKARKDPNLRKTQVWILRVNDDRSAFLHCGRDADHIAFYVRIALTDFPLPSIALYLEEGVLCLENER